MKNSFVRHFIGSVLALLVACYCMGAEPQTLTVSGRLSEDFYLLNDFKLLKLSDFEAAGSVWVIAHVTLDPGSYVATVHDLPGAPTAIPTIYLKGNCKILAKLSGDFAKEEFAFDWNIPSPGRAGSSKGGAIPSYALRNGILIIRVDPKAEKEKLFQITTVRLTGVDMLSNRLISSTSGVY